MKATSLFVTTIFFCLTANASAAEKISMNFSETLASSQVAPDGYLTVDGMVNQVSIGLDINSLSLWYWNDYSFNDGRLNEHDFGAMYSFAPRETSFGSFIPFVRAEQWKWPGNGHDDSASVGFNYRGFIDGHLRFTKLVTDGIKDGGNRLYGILSKKFIRNDFSITPHVKIALLDKFYGVSGIGHITPGIEIGYALTEKASLSGFYEYQIECEYPNHSYGGISLNIRF